MIGHADPHQDPRGLLTAARAEGEQNLRKIMQRIEGYGLRIPAIAGDIVVVDADDDKNAVTSAPASAELARGDRAKESGKAQVVAADNTAQTGS